MAAATGMDDDESWLYGEANQDVQKRIENEESEEPMLDDTENITNVDDSSRLSRFSNDSGTGAESQDKSNRDGSIRGYDDKEAGELSGEEEISVVNTVSSSVTGEGESVNHGGRVDDREGEGERTGEEIGDVDVEADADADGEGDGEGDGERRSDESDSDDDSVQVTIGDIKAAPSYGYAGPPVNLNIKRGGAYPQSGPGGQSSKTKGVDLDSVGMINGVPTYEFNLDTMEDKPWRKPGADITDYFNYGFNEDTWKAYCEKQRKLRLEAAGGSNTGLVASKPHHTGKDQQIPVATVNENSKYAGGLLKKAGPPPGRKTSGSIDVIGASTTTSRRPLTQSPKENVIQVMTADKREYSRKPNAPPFDTSMPPPPPGMMPPIGLGVFPPDLAMPPPGLPPGFPPPGLPPPNIPLPPPNYGDSFDGYNRNYPPPPGSGPPDRLPPGFDNSYEGSYYNGGANSGNNAGSSQDAYNPFEPTGDGPWDGRDNPGSRYSQSRSPTNEDEFDRRHRDFRDRSRDRDRDRDRERDRDRDRERHRERDREPHRERDRDRDRDRERDYDTEDRRDTERRHREHRDRDDKHSRSSRRKHRDDEDSSDHRSSRHKRKRSKRDKDEESIAGVDQQDAMPDVNEEESQQE